jgi:hypothetical protein
MEYRVAREKRKYSSIQKRSTSSVQMLESRKAFLIDRSSLSFAGQTPFNHAPPPPSSEEADRVSYFVSL